MNVMHSESLYIMTNRSVCNLNLSIEKAQNSMFCTNIKLTCSSYFNRTQ